MFIIGFGIGKKSTTTCGGQSAIEKHGSVKLLNLPQIINCMVVSCSRLLRNGRLAVKMP